MKIYSQEKRLDLVAEPARLSLDPPAVAGRGGVAVKKCS